MADAREPAASVRRTRGRPLLLAGLLLFGTFVGFGVVEGGLRARGFVPWEFLATERDEPALCEPDPALGWRNRPGRHVFPAFVPDAPATVVNIAPDGSRVTAPERKGGRPAFVMAGCSYTYGWGIDDAETYAWRLQQRFPELEVLNYGTPAYGTYQSLLRIEQVLAETPAPRYVFYGFIAAHEERNVASAEWLRVLALYNERGYATTPYVTWSPRGLVRHSPSSHWTLPGRESSAAITAAEELGMHWLARARTADRRRATEALLVEMNGAARQRGARFVVGLLEASGPTREHYAEFLMAQRIPFIDIAFPRTQAYKIAGEEHPNGAMNARWAESIEQAFAAWGWR